MDIINYAVHYRLFWSFNFPLSSLALQPSLSVRPCGLVIEGRNQGEYRLNTGRIPDMTQNIDDKQ